MVARPGQYQASFNSAELSPSVWGRSDIKQFYSGASLMEGCEPVPQGGFDNAPGSIMTGQARNPFQSIGFATSEYTPGPHAAAATISLVTFAEPRRLAAVDLTGFYVSGGTLVGAVRIETSLDGVAWQPFGTAINTGNTAREYRIAVAPGAGVLAAAVRLRLWVSPGGTATFGLSTFQCLEEADGIAAAWRSFEHTYSVDTAFTITFTPGCADVWRGDEFVASFAHPVTAAMLPTLGRVQRFNTMLLWHPDLVPQRILRVDGDHDWRCTAAPFTNLPDVDYGGSYTKVADTWTVYLSFLPTGNYPEGVGLTASMMINGEETSGAFVGSGPAWSTFADDMQAAIVALPSVAPGATFAYVSHDTKQAVFTLTFTGTGNLGNVFTVVPRIVNSGEAAATAVHTQVGSPGGEPIMSSTRGYPSAGGFYQDRLYTSGFKAEGGAVLGSVTGEYYDLNTLIENAAGGVLFRLDTDGAERVLHLAQAKHLVIFTDTAEYYVSDRAIVRGTPPNVARSSRNGAAAGIRPVESNDGLLYVGKSRSIVFLANYSDVSQKYESEPISLLASHLIRGIGNVALETSSLSTDASRYWIVRDDGLMIVGVIIRNQEVIGFVRWPTDGLVRDVCVDGANRVYALIERPVGAATRVFRERLTVETDLHQQVAFTYGAPQTLVSGLEQFEGAEVWAYADGYAEGPHLVTGGAITLDNAALSVRVGRWRPPVADTLPLPRMIGERMQLARPARVHTVRVVANGATSLAIGANGRPPRDMALLKGGQPGDQPIQPYSGKVEATGLAGWTEDGIVRLTQVRPGKFSIRSVTIEAKV